MSSRLSTALSVALLGVALAGSPASAQGRGGGMRGGMRGGAGSGIGPLRTTGGRSRFGRGRGAGYYGGAVLAPYDYYSDDGYDEGVPPPEEPPVRVVVVRPSAPAPPPAPPVESLLLEDQSGQWVRVPTGGQVPTGLLSSQPGAGRATSSPAGATEENGAAQPASAAPNAVLVFRDGHQEEITGYVIQGSVIYAKVDYWSTGTWTKKIPISELNVPATLRLNRERGAKFDLPSGPDEVVVGF